jgi:hypothetical protein
METLKTIALTLLAATLAIGLFCRALGFGGGLKGGETMARTPQETLSVHRGVRGRPGMFGLSANNVGGELTPEEVAYARFIDAQKRRHGIKFPTWSLVLAWTKEFLFRRAADVEGGNPVSAGARLIHERSGER